MAFGIGSVGIGRPAVSGDLRFDKGSLQLGTAADNQPTDTEVGTPLLRTQP